MFWKPFDVRFRDVISRFQHHRLLLDREIQTGEAVVFTSVLKGIENTLAEMKDLLKLREEVGVEENKNESKCSRMQLLLNLLTDG